MPAANARAMQKARTLNCDAIIFDLEDAVAVNSKTSAREQLIEELHTGGYGYRERIVRVNGLSTPWCEPDVSAVAGLDIHGILFPKVNSATELLDALVLMDSCGGQSLPIWAMLETPRAVLDADAIVSASSRLTTLVMGTSDLVTELRATHTPDRNGLQAALQHCVLVARAHGRDILDGVHLDFRNQDSFKQTCEQGRQMGFDGRTLIHPTQIDVANEIFGFSGTAVEEAREIIQAWQHAQEAGKGVVEVGGRLIENLHVAEAQRVIEFAEQLSGRDE